MTSTIVHRMDTILTFLFFAKNGINGENFDIKIGFIYNIVLKTTNLIYFF